MFPLLLCVFLRVVLQLFYFLLFIDKEDEATVTQDVERTPYWGKGGIILFLRQ